MKMLKNNIKKIILVTLGSALVSAGIYFFVMDYQIPMGGLSGFAIAVQNIYPNMQVGYIMTIFNVALFIISYIFLGKEYVGYTMYSSLVVSNVITLFENLVPLSSPLTDNILLSLIIGILLIGVGTALVLMQGATTGGTEIIASIVNKYTHIAISKSIMLVDAIVVIFGMYAINLEAGLYALVSIGFNTMVIDWAISGFNTKINMIIISKEYNLINKFIIDKMVRGTTLYYAEGGYSKDEKKVVQTVVSRKEYLKIKNYVAEVDPKAFVTMNYVNEVEGEGFTYD